MRTTIVTLKLSPEERALLKRLVQARTTELRAATSGARVEVTSSAYIRELIARDAEARGLGRAAD